MSHLGKKVQFSSVQLLSRVRLFTTPWIAACQTSLSVTNSWSSIRLFLLLKSHNIWACFYFIVWYYLWLFIVARYPEKKSMDWPLTRIVYLKYHNCDKVTVLYHHGVRTCTSGHMIFWLLHPVNQPHILFDFSQLVYWR